MIPSASFDNNIFSWNKKHHMRGSTVFANNNFVYIQNAWKSVCLYLCVGGYQLITGQNETQYIFLRSCLFFLVWGRNCENLSLSERITSSLGKQKVIFFNVSMPIPENETEKKCHRTSRNLFIVYVWNFWEPLSELLLYAATALPTSVKPLKIKHACRANKK